MQYLYEINTPPLLDDVNNDGTLVYIGFSSIGTATSSANWAILRQTVVGTITSYTFPNSDEQNNYVWDNRASYTYSR
jgi:hypothetical protein